MTTRWRGTLVYVGSAAVIGVAAFAKLQVSQAEAAAHASHGTAHHVGMDADMGTGDGSHPAHPPTSASSPTPAIEQSAPAPSAPAPSAPAPSDPAAVETASPPAEEPHEVTITGDVIETREGHVQVAVSFRDSTIVEIVALQAGHGGKAADEFNAKVLPVLRAAALDAQSAQFDTVTGATYTSEGYKASLQSAIDQLG